MSIRNAITGFRNVRVEFSNAWNTVDGSETAQIAAPIDAFKAAMVKVEELEGRFSLLGAAGVPDLTGATVLVVGANPNEIHQYTVTSVMAAGTYEFIYVQTRAQAVTS